MAAIRRRLAPFARALVAALSRDTPVFRPVPRMFCGCPRDGRRPEYFCLRCGQVRCSTHAPDPHDCPEAVDAH